MVRVTIEEIQRDPLEYLRRVEEGETLVVVRSHEAISEIRPIPPRQHPPLPLTPSWMGYMMVARNWAADRIANYFPKTYLIYP